MTDATGALGESRRLSACVLLLLTGMAVVPGGVPIQAMSTAARLALGSAVLLGAGTLLCLAWPRRHGGLHGTRHGHAAGAVIVALGVLALLAWGSTRMLPVLFAGPTNSREADMLIVIQRGVERFLSASNPYVIYEVPWPAPLPYGPWLWLPFLVPHWLHADPRVLTLVAHGTVVVGVGLAATIAARTGAAVAGGLLAVLAGALALHPGIESFYRIGHTQVYWPLLFLFCWLLARGRWTAAAASLGALVVARTTMVSLVPVFLLHMLIERQITWRLVAVLGASMILPFVPFWIADPASLSYAMYGSYQKVMKGFVWTSTTWAHDTLGLTGPLLRQGLSAWVEPVQAVALLVLYLAAWRALKRGSPVQPWMVLALLVFSMTTLWPVHYVYYDVFVLAASALATHVLATRRPALRPVTTMPVLLAGAAVVVLAVAAVSPGAAYTLDIGTPASAGLTGAGFGQDVPETEGERTFVSVAGDVARVRLPRAGWGSTTVHLVAKGGEDEPAPFVRATLNGRTLGVARLQPGWTTLSFRAPRHAWRFGFNLLELRFTAETSPADGQAPKVAAIDAVRVGR